MINRRTVLGMIPAAMGVQAARAQPLDKTVRVIVGFPAGGGMDVSARLLASAMQGLYAQNIIVENRTGAAGRIAIESVKNSEPDGTTILACPSQLFTIYPHVYRKLGYDLERDFKTVAQFCSIAYSISVGPAVPESVRTISDYAQWVRANPKQASFGSGSPGTSLHFTGVMLARALNLPLVHVGYRGGPPLAQDLMAGVIPMAVQSLPETVELVKAGRVRSLAVTTAQRSPALPNVPTLIESGVKDVVVNDVFGIFLPAKTPEAISRHLAASVAAALQKPDMQDALKKMTFDTAYQNGTVYAEYLKRETGVWRRVVEDSGFKVDE